MRQFRNATLGSYDALNATIRLEHARIFTFLVFPFLPQWKFLFILTKSLL